MKTLLTLLVFFIVFSTAYAQESGYVIKQTGDTVICSITLTRQGNYKWKTDAEKDWKNFEGMQEVHLDQSNVTYYLRILPDSTQAVFLKLLEKGTIQLYEQVSFTQKLWDKHIPVITWYMSKNDHFQIIPVYKNKPALLAFLADKPQIARYFKTDSYNDYNIENIIHQYNTGRTLLEEKEAEDARPLD